MRNRFTIGKAFFYLVTGLLSLLFIAPLLWAVWVSVSPHAATAQSEGFGLNNYRALLTYGEGLSTYIVNSLIVSLTTLVVTLCVTATGGYAFSRFSFKGRRSLFILTLSVMMVPYAALLIPMIVWLKTLYLSNNLIGVGLVLALFQLPFGVFMMRNAFEQIPRDLEEAALLDGCGGIQAFWRILLPAVRPATVTVGLISFLFAWNDFMVSLYMISTGAKNPLPLALVNMRQQTLGVIDYGITTAGVVALTLPAAILFLALQKYYVKGFTSGAVKG